MVFPLAVVKFIGKHYCLRIFNRKKAPSNENLTLEKVLI